MQAGNHQILTLDGTPPIRVQKGLSLYDIYIDGRRITGDFGPDIINGMIQGNDKHLDLIKTKLPPDMTQRDFHIAMREFPRIQMPKVKKTDSNN